MPKENERWIEFRGRGEIKEGSLFTSDSGAVSKREDGLMAETFTLITGRTPPFGPELQADRDHPQTEPDPRFFY